MQDRGEKENASVERGSENSNHAEGPGHHNEKARWTKALENKDCCVELHEAEAKQWLDICDNAHQDRQRHWQKRRRNKIYWTNDSVDLSVPNIKEIKVPGEKQSYHSGQVRKSGPLLQERKGEEKCQHCDWRPILGNLTYCSSCMAKVCFWCRLGSNLCAACGMNPLNLCAITVKGGVVILARKDGALTRQPVSLPVGPTQTSESKSAHASRPLNPHEGYDTDLMRHSQPSDNRFLQPIVARWESLSSSPAHSSAPSRPVQQKQPLCITYPVGDACSHGSLQSCIWGCHDPRPTPNSGTPSRPVQQPQPLRLTYPVGDACSHGSLQSCIWGCDDLRPTPI